MRVVAQRVKASSVVVEGAIIGQIGKGLTLLVGIALSDTEAELEWMAQKILNLRVFSAEGQGGWDLSISEIKGELLVVSQFTLYGDSRKGRRPSFSGAAAPEVAEGLYEQFVAKLRESGLKIATGTFGAVMQVEIQNDGPVTLLLEKEAT